MALSENEFQSRLEKGEAKVTPVEAPVLYATAINVANGSNNFSLQFSRPRPLIVEIDGQQAQAAHLEPVAVIDMSPATAKDLFLLMRNVVTAHESEFGEIVTEYTQRLAGK